jgi:pyridoxal phosphate enzyme (YggS family)
MTTTEVQSTESSVIISNLQEIHQRIDIACAKAGRKREDIRLLLATKTVPVEKIRIAIDAGENLIAENKVQELTSKIPLLSGLSFERHFIGHLQTNKIKEVLKYVSCIQSVDRCELAEKLDKRLHFEGRSIEILVQVNTSFEESKFGVHPDAALALLKKMSSYDALRVKGLMTIGLFDADPEKVRRSFALLRQIRDRAMNEGLLPADAFHLSMGMSGDFETAIEEGATIIRIGTAIFGKRPYPDSYYWNENK